MTDRRKVKLTSIRDAVACIPDGSKIAIGGSLVRRAPMALVREMVRQNKKDLTLYSWSAGMDFDMLMGAGCVKEAWSSYVGLFQLGIAGNFRRAVEQKQLRFVDISETCGMDKFRAAAYGNSFCISKTPLHSDLLKNPEFKEIVCPFTGERYVAMEAFHSDYAIIHASRADCYGNVQFDTYRMMDNEIDPIIAKSAKHVIVSVEEIVPEEEIIKTSFNTLLPKVFVDAVVLAPFGSHPNSCDARYDFDLSHGEKYASAAKKQETFDAYLDEYVRGTASEEQYIEKVGGAEELMRRLGH